MPHSSEQVLNDQTPEEVIEIDENGGCARGRKDSGATEVNCLARSGRRILMPEIAATDDLILRPAEMGTRRWHYERECLRLFSTFALLGTSGQITAAEGALDTQSGNTYGIRIVLGRLSVRIADGVSKGMDNPSRRDAQVLGQFAVHHALGSVADKLHGGARRHEDRDMARQIRALEAEWARLARARTMALEHMLRFDRIEHLLSPEDLREKRVVQVGVGSGGAPVNEHLTMNGARRWVLFDPERYDDVNLVKHPRLRADLDEFKVENQKKWILDRNFSAEVEAVPEDVMQSARFRDAVREADLVLCCADKQEARLFVNAVATEMQRPCVTASVFRRGFGGEAYAYIPYVSGCFDCMLRVATAQGWNMEGPVELLPVEKERSTV